MGPDELTRPRTLEEFSTEMDIRAKLLPQGVCL